MAAQRKQIDSIELKSNNSSLSASSSPATKSRLPVNSSLSISQSLNATFHTSGNVNLARCAITWGRNSYIIFNNFLPNGAKLAFKAAGSPVLYEDKAVFLEKFSDEKVKYCFLCKCITTDNDNLFVIEYHFSNSEGTPIRTLQLEASWTDVKEIDFDLAGGDQFTKAIPNNFSVTTNNSDGVPTGVFFVSNNFDSVKEILSSYYEYRCKTGNCITIRNPVSLAKWGPYINSEGTISKDALLNYWSNSKSTIFPNNLTTAMMKHDRSPVTSFGNGPSPSNEFGKYWRDSGYIAFW